MSPTPASLVVAGGMVVEESEKGNLGMVVLWWEVGGERGEGEGEREEVGEKKG